IFQVRQSIGVEVDTGLELPCAEELSQQSMAFAYNDIVLTDPLQILPRPLWAPSLYQTHDRLVGIVVKGKFPLPLGTQKIFVFPRPPPRRHQPGIVGDHRDVVIVRGPVTLLVLERFRIESSLRRIIASNQTGFDKSG